jgi:hypothetical protein
MNSLMSRVKWDHPYSLTYGVGMDENPSPEQKRALPANAQSST